MKDREKTKEQLINELEKLRQRNAELEELEVQGEHMEEALREAEARYRSIFENAVEGIFQTSVEGRIITANPALARMFGYSSPGELISEVTDVQQLYSDPDYRKEFIRLMQVQENGIVIGFESQVQRKDGSKIWIMENARTLRESTGRLIGFEGMAIDITDRKRVEEALRESEMRFRSLAQSATDAIISIDSTGNIISWNKSAHTIFGYTEEEASGKPVTILMPERYKDAHQRGLKRVNSTNETSIIGKTVEFAGLRNDGSEFPLELSLSTWKIGERRFYAGIIRDISRRKQAEEALKNYATKLKEANHLKDLFTDIMRHDLLNPLGIIRIAMEQILITEPEDERMRTTLLMIKRNADKLIEMIESAGMYAILESAEKLERSKLDLNEVLAAVTDNFKPQLEEKNMKLEYISEGGCCIMANPMIDAVFSNLLSNAIKYSPSGRKIEIRVMDRKERFRIEVKDWGYGIKDEDKLKLFTRFQRLDKKGVKGSGLGLAIVKRIVDLHGGKVWIEDNPEGGSIFCVEISKA